MRKNKKTNANHLFPVFLKLESLQVLIVGGGPVALEKLKALLQNEPSTSIRMIAPQFHEELLEFALRYKNVRLVKKHFKTDDLGKTDIVISAVNDLQTSKQIQKAARKRRILINAADKPELCDFYLGSIVQKGNLKIAISTNGKSPTVAKRLKEILDDALPDELNEVLENLVVIRNNLKGDFLEKVHKLNKITSVLAGKQKTKVKSGRKKP